MVDLFGALLIPQGARAVLSLVLELLPWGWCRLEWQM